MLLLVSFPPVFKHDLQDGNLGQKSRRSAALWLVFWHGGWLTLLYSPGPSAQRTALPAIMKAVPHRHAYKPIK